jgi:Protein of unknown function (DUF4197)
MKRLRISLIALLFASFGLSGCSTLKQLGLVPSDYEMAMGLKAALEQGLFRSFDAFKDPSVNPLLAFVFPGDAEKIMKTLENLGFGSVVEKTTGKINRAMSSAFTTAKPIFLNSLKRMSIGDAAKILITDNDHAATDYFKASTRTDLVAAMRPIADSTVKIEGADKDWNRIASVVNNLPFVNIKIETSLSDFVAARAVDGMYLIVAEEEAKIRRDINFRKTDLLQRVFGYADAELKKRAASQ